MNWKRVLLRLKKLPVEEQVMEKELLMKAFKYLWDSNPTEEEFASYTSGLLVCPEQIYYMVKEK